jgi:hypothetical protein
MNEKITTDMLPELNTLSSGAYTDNAEDLLKSQDICSTKNASSFYVSNLKFTEHGVEYKWLGGFGALMESLETERVSENSYRRICGIPFYVFSVEVSRRFMFFPVEYRICWCPAKKVDCDWHREFKQIIFL